MTLRQSPSGPIDLSNAVPFAALAGLSGERGSVVAVRENLGIYQWVDSQLLAPNGAQVVNAPGGQWVRVELGSQYFASQAALFVDSAAGSDSNDGLTAATAMRTLVELTTRLFETSVTVAQTVTFAGDYTGQDLVCKWSIKQGLQQRLTATGRTTIYSGVLTGVINQNPAGQQRQQIQDGATLGAAGNVGQIIRLTSGANVGATAQTIVSTAGDTLLTGPFSRRTGNTPAQVFPIVGDAFTVEALTPVRTVTIDVTPEADFNTGPAFPLVVEGWAVAGEVRTVQLLGNASVALPLIQNCRIVGVVINGAMQVQQCLLVPVGGIGNYRFNQLRWSVFLGSGASGSMFIGTADNSNMTMRDVVVQGRVVVVASSLFQNVGIFPFSGLANDGLRLDTLDSELRQTTGLLWGSGHSGAGCRIELGGVFASSSATPPILTGAGSDVQIASLGSTWAAAVFNSPKNTGVILA